MAKFNVCLKDLMKEKNMSQWDLERASGVRQSSISDYLTGKYKPKTGKIVKLAHGLDINPLILFLCEDINPSVMKFVYDKRLSYRARGLMAVMIFVFGSETKTFEKILKETDDSVDAVFRALRELEILGYIFTKGENIYIKHFDTLEEKDE